MTLPKLPLLKKQAQIKITVIIYLESFEVGQHHGLLSGKVGLENCKMLQENWLCEKGHDVRAFTVAKLVGPQAGHPQVGKHLENLAHQGGQSVVSVVRHLEEKFLKMAETSQSVKAVHSRTFVQRAFQNNQICQLLADGQHALVVQNVLLQIQILQLWVLQDEVQGERAEVDFQNFDAVALVWDCPGKLKIKYQRLNKNPFCSKLNKNKDVF